MARSDLKELYKELISNEFSFLPRGENKLIYIYKKVQLQHPQLCDDNFLCIDNCTNGNNEPEWHHALLGEHLIDLKEYQNQLKNYKNEGIGNLLNLVSNLLK